MLRRKKVNCTNAVIGRLQAPLRTLLKTSEMFVVIKPYLRPPSCERAHNWKGTASSHCNASELILPIIFICFLNLRSVLAKAARHTKFFKILSLNRVIKLLAK